MLSRSLKTIQCLALIFVVLSALASSAAECEGRLSETITLDWTQTSDSVQATIWHARNALKIQDEQSQFPQGYVSGAEGQLSVSDGKETINCQSRSAGIIAVQQYWCEASSSNFPWTLSSKSVQAILFDALYRLKAVDDASGAPQGYVKSDGGILIAEDVNTKLTCLSGSPGPMPVRQYRCQFEKK